MPGHVFQCARFSILRRSRRRYPGTGRGIQSLPCYTVYFMYGQRWPADHEEATAPTHTALVCPDTGGDESWIFGRVCATGQRHGRAGVQSSRGNSLCRPAAIQGSPYRGQGLALTTTSPGSSIWRGWMPAISSQVSSGAAEHREFRPIWKEAFSTSGTGRRAVGAREEDGSHRWNEGGQAGLGWG